MMRILRIVGVIGLAVIGLGYLTYLTGDNILRWVSAYWLETAAFLISVVLLVLVARIIRMEAHRSRRPRVMGIPEEPEVPLPGPADYDLEYRRAEEEPPIREPLLEEPRTKPGFPQISFRLGWALFWVIAVFGLGFLFWNPPPLGLALGFATLGVDLVYLGTCLHEVRAPNVGMLFRMGAFIGKLDPGWYLTIPHFWDIEPVPTAWQQVDLEGTMYISEKTPITVKARVFYRADKNKLDEILLMMPKEMEERARVIGLAVLRGEIGTYGFKKLVGEKETLEKEGLTRLTTEFEKYGYEVRDFEIYDFEETTLSEAERIKALGKARGEAAAALALPLKDNYPAAIVSSIGTMAEAAEKIASGRTRSRKSSGSEGTAAKSEGTKSADLPEKLNRALDKILGG